MDGDDQAPTRYAEALENADTAFKFGFVTWAIVVYLVVLAGAVSEPVGWYSWLALCALTWLVAFLSEWRRLGRLGRY